jgi:hypothetical protein
MSAGSPIVLTEHHTITQPRVWYEHEEFSWGPVHGVDVWRYEEFELNNGEELDFLEDLAQYSIVPPLWDGDETFMCRIGNRLIEVTMFRVLSAAQSG